MRFFLTHSVKAMFYTMHLVFQTMQIWSYGPLAINSGRFSKHLFFLSWLLFQDAWRCSHLFFINIMNRFLMSSILGPTGLPFSPRCFVLSLKIDLVQYIFFNVTFLVKCFALSALDMPNVEIYNMSQYINHQNPCFSIIYQE